MAGVPSSLELFRSIRRRLLRGNDSGPVVRERTSLKWKSVGTPSGMFTVFVGPEPPPPPETFFIEFNDGVDIGDFLYEDGVSSGKLIHT